jgi:hypothetical protein
LDPSRRKTKVLFVKLKPEKDSLLADVCKARDEVKAEFVRDAVDEKIERLAEEDPRVAKILAAHRAHASRAKQGAKPAAARG